MENIEWFPFLYNGIETNIEVTSSGLVKKVKKEWYGQKYVHKNIYYGEIDLSKFVSFYGYNALTVQIKGVGRKTISVHQMVASVFLGYVFNGTKDVVDHIDSNKTNNNVSNLRIVSNRQNCSKEKTKKSGLPAGVYLPTWQKKYKATIQINGKRVYLGYFNTPEEASEKYQSVLKTLL